MDKEREVITAADVGVLDVAAVLGGLPTTREGQEAHVRMVQRLCNGPLLVKEGTERARWKRWRALEADGDWGSALGMALELRDAAQALVESKSLVVYLPPAPPEGDWSAMRRAVFPLLRLRGVTIGQGCGNNLNDEIVKHPFDGAEHQSICPKCGVVTSWKAPTF